mmetsp:Transcript_36095/g.81129  ORF Transcript_36095/g.81129 Transcript_36095/m.81129 type:complete len:236 (+) Transcript_36095:2455-3162(+)
MYSCVQSSYESSRRLISKKAFSGPLLSTCPLNFECIICSIAISDASSFPTNKSSSLHVDTGSFVVLQSLMSNASLTTWTRGNVSGISTSCPNAFSVPLTTEVLMPDASSRSSGYFLTALDAWMPNAAIKYSPRTHFTKDFCRLILSNRSLLSSGETPSAGRRYCSSSDIRFSLNLSTSSSLRDDAPLLLSSTLVSALPPSPCDLFRSCMSLKKMSQVESTNSSHLETGFPLTSFL